MVNYDGKGAQMSQYNKIYDTSGKDTLFGTNDEDRFILERDGKLDEIFDFENSEDKVNLNDFDVTFDSIMLKQISLTEYVVYIRDEVIKITFNTPATTPNSGWLLGEHDFVFAKGLPDPPVQVHLEQSDSAGETIYGTTLPDVFIFSDDAFRDTVFLFEPGKDILDLTGYNVSYGDLSFADRNGGRVAISIPVQSGGIDRLVVRDPSLSLTTSDIETDWFIF